VSRTKPVDSMLSEAEQIARVWMDNPTFTLGDLTLAQFQTQITNLRTQRGATEDLRTQLTAAINGTNSKALAISEAITRARSGFRAFFGPDSTQYEQAGGTRKSERKRPTRKSTT
jgi:hypothetical protein